MLLIRHFRIETNSGSPSALITVEFIASAYAVQNAPDLTTKLYSGNHGRVVSADDFCAWIRAVSTDDPLAAAAGVAAEQNPEPTKG